MVLHTFTRYMKIINIALKKRIYEIILLIFILPVIFINVNKFHDWGDDFAQYIYQTKKFVTNEKSFAPKILNSESHTPIQRGEGFSLILSPVYYFYGDNIEAMIRLISIFLFLTGIVLFVFFNSKYSNTSSKLISLLLVLIILYNYHTLLLKMEIMPVFPYMLILYICILMYDKINLFTPLFIFSILTGLLLSIWNMGWAFYITILIHFSIKIIRNYNLLKLKQLMIFIFIPILCYISIKLLIFKNISMQNITWYGNIFTFSYLKNIIFENLHFYLFTLKVFFEQEVWGWANILIKDFALVLFIIGMVNKWRTKIDITDIYFIIHILILLCYPYKSAGIRFILPLIPIIMIYIVNGINSIILKVNIKKEYLISCFLIVILSSNYINIKNLILNGDSKINGPQNKESVELFKTVKKMIPNTSIIAFTKPWTLYFYTNRVSLYINNQIEIQKLKKELIMNRTNYVLLCIDSLQYDIYNDKLNRQIKNSTDFKLIWENKKFVLLELTDLPFTL